ncbi:MAG: Endonuclease/Exonuclease/phosphatase family protein [Pelotomaculum sp. PtaB.Bin013]|uniref:Endonuclease/exonuclease/phosphatase family protein n=1 Tax=Pelotomaculum isophthalicicum JI TaxID=947010 RepID=A0A9X4H3L1_9FIRM|nr:endonuclease/exonuclease/phosphatase family protein [Pelotomaculum isophthalicicum]MDF9409726.1 endonuclease/exonuclease/phosphatase family protein [Pelotomaculum isophthalicicum JI]OPX89021.1 MAG: Endonuclease/Exonuclease/phosphatase family protein [Pelotomaculum sp. PtaB.Bin013]
MHLSYFKIPLIIVLGLLSFFVLFLVYINLTGYKPKDVVALNVNNNSFEGMRSETMEQESVIKKNTPLSMITFNIGYCGLDRNQDFFMDGGKSSRSFSKEQTLINLENITRFFQNDKPSFILIQEADVSSTRSYHINQKEYLEKELTGYASTFGVNYQVSWVPAPLLHPMGAVYSGLLTLSRYKSDSAARFQYPGREKWLRQMFDLDRCFIENRLPVEGGKELVLINSHLSAFDEGGLIRQKQLEFLKKHISEEYYDKGNYVIVGGDWNHILPGTNPGIFGFTEEKPFWVQEMPQDFTPAGFKWAVDRKTPSVRSTAAPYQEKQNFVAVIDGFLVSPNIEIQNCQGYQLNFENSDHNPVSFIFTLSYR